MDIDYVYYAVVIAFSCVGFVYFSFGRKLNRPAYIIAGMALMAYSYFCDTSVEAALWGAGLSALPFLGKYL